MALHVIVGSGAVGRATAQHLLDAGHQVRMITRRGTGIDHPHAERIAADAADPDRMTALATGAASLYNCASPRYHRWPIDWPPIAHALLSAAERTGAGLVTMSNLYGYGPVDHPMTEDLPLAAGTVKGRVRTRMWQEALAAHEAGLARVTEARGSDFVGAGAGSILNGIVLPNVARGRRVLAPVDFDVPHSFTYTGDAGAMLAALGTDDRSWGRAWHVPTDVPATVRQVARRYAHLRGAPEPRLTRVPSAIIRLIGLVSPEVRETVEIRYQFDRPFVVDSTAAQDTFGLRPTSLDDILRTLC